MGIIVYFNPKAGAKNSEKPLMENSWPPKLFRNQLL